MTIFIRCCVSAADAESRAGASELEIAVRLASMRKRSTEPGSPRRRGSFFLDCVIVRVVVIPVLGNLTTRIIQDGTNDPRPDIDELLVGPLGSNPVGLSRSNHEEDAVGQGAEDTGVRCGQDWRSVQNDQVEALGELLKENSHPNTTEQAGRIGRQRAAGE